MFYTSFRVSVTTPTASERTVTGAKERGEASSNGGRWVKEIHYVQKYELEWGGVGDIKGRWSRQGLIFSRGRIGNVGTSLGCLVVALYG